MINSQALHPFSDKPQRFKIFLCKEIGIRSVAADKSKHQIFFPSLYHLRAIVIEES